MNFGLKPHFISDTGAVDEVDESSEFGWAGLGSMNLGLNPHFSDIAVGFLCG